MVIALAAGIAAAAPVECDPLAAAALLSDARIDEARAPVTHAELLPGLALASPGTPADLRTAIGDLCAPTDGRPDLAVRSMDAWEAPGWSAHAFLLVRSEVRGCSLYQRAVAISVGIAEGATPRYRLRSRGPVTRTPVGECADRATWREEKTIGGEGGAVRLVLVADREDGRPEARTALVVRSAGPAGWTETVLVEPAPERLVGGRDGPSVELAAAGGETWVVSRGDRRTRPDGSCESVGGTTVWMPGTEGWTRHDGRPAVGLLASRGLWRLAGSDGWMLLYAVHDEDDARRVDVRSRRFQRKAPAGEELHVFPSELFPDLNPGFLVVAPDPWPDESGAQEALRSWRGVPVTAYVKRAWDGPDACSD